MTFVRLHVTSEGQTEEAFVKRILAPHLGAFNVFSDARSVLTSRDKKAYKHYREGLLSYIKAKADIQTWMKEDGHAECRFTTMFDLYALPDDFPGYTDAKRETDPYREVQALERAMGEDIGDHRFIPYIQLHEFEALILADVGKLDWEYLDHDAPIRRLVQMVGNRNPELIDDTPDGVPSKRILRELPEYDKANLGVLVAERIGLEIMKTKCSHFRNWLELLERLARTR
jgi:hypothetical protein